MMMKAHHYSYVANLKTILSFIFKIIIWCAIELVAGLVMPYGIISLSIGSGNG